MAFAQDPFNLLPSCSHRFYLGVYFFFYRWFQKKQEPCFYPRSKKAKGKRVGSVWEAKIGQNKRPSWGDVLHYDANGPLRNLRLCMKGRKQSDDTVKMPNTPWQTSGRGRLIVSHLRPGLLFLFLFFYPLLQSFSPPGDSYLLLLLAACQFGAETPESAPLLKCAYLQPHATFHTAATNQASKPESRLNHRSVTRPVNYSLVSVTPRPVEPWLNERPCSADFQRYNRSTFAAPLLYLHLSETGPAGCQRLLSGYFCSLLPVRSTSAEITKDNGVMQLAKPKWNGELSLMMPPLIGPTVKQADGFITDNNYTIY